MKSISFSKKKLISSKVKSWVYYMKQKSSELRKVTAEEKTTGSLV